MSAGRSTDARSVHSIPGRIRVHLPGWSGSGQHGIEAHLRGRPGVRRVQANALTGNVLIHFDPAAADEAEILAAVRTIELDRTEVEEPPPPAIPAERRKGVGRARIPVRGLDRDPNLAAAVVERLERHPGIRATANPLTGRVLVELSDEAVDLRDLRAEVAEVEPPALPGETPPPDPLDRAALLQSESPPLERHWASGGWECAGWPGPRGRRSARVHPPLRPR